MNKLQLGAVVLGAVAVAAAVVVGTREDAKPLDTKEFAVAVDVTAATPLYAGETVAQPSVLSVFPDGGKAYSVKVRLGDGGVSVRRLAAPDCVRREVGAPVDSCLRLVAGKGVDFGELNRFPASEAVGAGCTPVACSVMFGEDDSITDDERLAAVKASKEQRR